MKATRYILNSYSVETYTDNGYDVRLHTPLMFNSLEEAQEKMKEEYDKELSGMQVFDCMIEQEGDYAYIIFHDCYDIYWKIDIVEEDIYPKIELIAGYHEWVVWVNDTPVYSIGDPTECLDMISEGIFGKDTVDVIKESLIDPDMCAEFYEDSREIFEAFTEEDYERLSHAINGALYDYYIGD